MTGATKALLRHLLPRRIGPKRILAGPLRGRRIVTSWRDYPAAILGRTERRLLAWFEANVALGETWLDIGAHYGYTALALCRQVGSSGRVFAFEPMLATAGHLARTRVLNGLSQLTVLPLGLASPATLTLERSAIERGMIDPSAGGAWAETIVTARLDWIWPQICGGTARIDGAKIDVQGMEIEVLRGMVGLLEAHHPKLVIEVHAGVPRDELLSVLRGAGYSRPGVPIEPIEGEAAPQYVDDHSYFLCREL